MISGDAYFYNLATPAERHLSPAAANAEVIREIRAMLSTTPLFLGMCEAIGYSLPPIKGYQLVRDRSSESRANIALYASNELPIRHGKWVDLKTTWPKTERGGVHPARSFYAAIAGPLQIVVCHQAPKNAATVAQAQREGIDALTRLMAPDHRHRFPKLHPFAARRPRIVVGDFNAAACDGGPSTPGTLAQAIGGAVIDAKRIDTGVVRNLTVSNVEYLRDVAGVPMHSDHGTTLRFHIEGKRA